MFQNKAPAPKTVTREQFNRISDIGGVLPQGYVIVDDVHEDLKMA
jgi:hypothetical protein